MPLHILRYATVNTFYTAFISANLISEMIDSWQRDSTGCALQCEIINFVTMATYWVPDLPNVKGFSGFFWRFILIFFSDALFARSNKYINVFKVD